MADPMTALAATDTGAVVRQSVNQNFDRRHWLDVTATIVAGASPYTVLSTDEYLRVDPTAGAVTINLPAVASSANRRLCVEALNVANTVTLDPSGAELINGSATKTIGTAGRLVWLFCDGSAWTAHYSDRL